MDTSAMNSSVFKVSATINFSVFTFFIASPVIKQCFGRKNTRLSNKIGKLFEEKPVLLNRFFRDQVFSILIFTCGIILLFTTDVLQRPFLRSPEHAHTVFAINLGHYIYRFLQDIILRKLIPAFKINLLHHLVTIATYTVILCYEQNAISGVIGLLFEVNSIIFELSSLLKAFGVSKTSLLYAWFKFIGFLLTVIFRGIVPLVLLVVTSFNETPLRMHYVPLGIFFMNIVFFSMVNLWLIKTWLTSLQRIIFSRRFISELQRYRRNQEYPLNNVIDSQRALGGRCVTIVIPGDANFKLSRPIANHNMDCSESVVSNITTSRHERTLPSFDIFVNPLIPVSEGQTDTSTFSTAL